MTAVLWDLDDTLVSTIEARLRALAYAYEQCVGGKVDPRSLLREYGQLSVEGIGQALLGDDYQQFVDTYQERYFTAAAPVAPFEGVPAVLEALLTTGIPMIAMTSKVSWGATEELQQTGLLHYFHSVVGYDDTDEHRPEPDPVLEALDRLMIEEPESMFVVGDSAADVQAAREAGCQSIGALWGSMELDHLQQAKPDFVAYEPVDVLRIVKEGLEAA